MKILIIAFAATACSAGSIPALRASPPAAAALVSQLYEEFSCETSNNGCTADRTLVDMPGSALARYFDNQLVELWLADRNCVMRTREICNLDFDPVWASQDPVGTSFKVVPTANGTIVNVELFHSPTGDRKVLRYTLVRTAAGWRIRDIAQGGNWSLVALLSRHD